MQPATTRAGESGAIRARLNYIIDTGRPPVSIIDWPEMEHAAVPAEYREHEVEILDGRPLADRFTLDTHGFAFVGHKTAMKDFTDEAERRAVYDAEAADLVRRVSGARDVVVFDHTIRAADEAARTALGARPPVRGVHNDYTEASAPRRLADILGAEEAARRMKTRWAIVQIWRAIRRPVETDPMAICDARSIPHEGFIRIERRYRHRTAETYHIAFNPAHVWYTFPRMTRDEALVFKVYDSDASLPARFTAHTAFEDPTSPPGAAPRESIETRTFAFFD